MVVGEDNASIREPVEDDQDKRRELIGARWGGMFAQKKNKWPIQRKSNNLAKRARQSASDCTDNRRRRGKWVRDGGWLAFVHAVAKHHAPKVRGPDKLVGERTKWERIIYWSGKWKNGEGQEQPQKENDGTMDTGGEGGGDHHHHPIPTEGASTGKSSQRAKRRNTAEERGQAEDDGWPVARRELAPKMGEWWGSKVISGRN